MKRQTKKLAAGAAAAAAGIAAATAVRHVTKKREQSAQSMVSSGREGERQVAEVYKNYAALSEADDHHIDHPFHRKDVLLRFWPVLSGTHAVRSFV